MKKLGYILLICAIIWTAVIWSFSLKSADDSNLQSESVTEKLEMVIENISGKEVELDHGQVRKTAHFTEFFVLGVLIFFAFFCLQVKTNTLYSVSLPWTFGGAVTDELLQLLSDGRSAQITDVMIDFSGSLIAIGVLTLFSIKKLKQK